MRVNGNYVLDMGMALISFQMEMFMSVNTNMESRTVTANTNGLMGIHIQACSIMD
jgi:hypothetical protein